jgi:hypothetical protein
LKITALLNKQLTSLCDYNNKIITEFFILNIIYYVKQYILLQSIDCIWRFDGFLFCKFHLFLFYTVRISYQPQYFAEKALHVIFTEKKIYFQGSKGKALVAGEIRTPKGTTMIEFLLI